MARLLILLVFGAASAWATPSAAREWTDAAGRLVVRGEAFATNEHTVVVQKENGDLVGIRIDELSAEDQEFLRQREAEREKREAERQAAAEPADSAPQPPVAPAVPKGQLWTSRDGYAMRGHAVGFGRLQVVISRVARLISVNGTAFSNLSPIGQYVVLQMVAEFDDPTVQSEQDLNQWVKEQGGQPRSFTIEGVWLRLADGTKVLVPFFLFSDQDVSVLRPGWEQWKSEQASDEERQRQDFLMEVQAQQYQRERLLEKQRARQIQIMQLELLAAGAGLTTVWEVGLFPAPGVFARPLSVIVSARDSLQAQQMATAKFPGYVAGPVRALTP